MQLVEYHEVPGAVARMIQRWSRGNGALVFTQRTDRDRFDIWIRLLQAERRPAQAARQQIQLDRIVGSMPL